MWLALSVDHVVVVGIDHRRVRVGGNAQHAVKGTKSQFQLRDLRLQQYIVGLRVLSNAHDGIAAVQVADLYLVAVFQLLRLCLWNRLCDE